MMTMSPKKLKKEEEDSGWFVPSISYLMAWGIPPKSTSGRSMPGRFFWGMRAIFVSDKWKSTHRLGNYTTLRSWHVDSLGRYARLNLVRDERIYFSFIWLDFYYPFHYFPISFPDLLVFSALLSSSVHFWRQIQLYAEGFYFPIFVHDQMYQTLWQSSRTKPRSSHNTQRATGLHRCWVLFYRMYFSSKNNRSYHKQQCLSLELCDSFWNWKLQTRQG